MKTLSSLFNNQGFKVSSDQKRSKKPTFTKDSFNFLTLIEAWPEIIGERLAKHTIPLKNKNGALTILTNHSAFSQQLSFMEEMLIKKIVEKFPDLKSHIKKVNFQTNSQHFETMAKTQTHIKQEKKTEKNLPHPYSPEYRRLKQEAEDLLDAIEDQDIKTALVSIYMQGRYSK